MKTKDLSGKFLTSGAPVLLLLGATLAWSPAATAGDPFPARPLSADAPAKPEAELPSTGRNIARTGGGWINGSVHGVQLVLTFYNADKQPVPPDRNNGFAQFRKAGTDIRTPLYRKDNALIATEQLRPPFVFFVTLDLFVDGNDKAVERYTFQIP